jgi:hypothetical protein
VALRSGTPALAPELVEKLKGATDRGRKRRGDRGGADRPRPTPSAGMNGLSIGELARLAQVVGMRLEPIGTSHAGTQPALAGATRTGATHTHIDGAQAPARSPGAHAPAHPHTAHTHAASGDTPGAHAPAHSRAPHSSAASSGAGSTHAPAHPHTAHTNAASGDTPDAHAPAHSRAPHSSAASSDACGAHAPSHPHAARTSAASASARPSRCRGGHRCARPACRRHGHSHSVH